MIIFDTETTGLLSPEPCNLELQPHIIEFAAIKVNVKGKLLDQYETMIKPPIPVPSEITRITGIREEDVKDAPPFVQVWEDIANFFRNEVVCCGHNVMFDINMLVNELRRIDKQYSFPFTMNRLCTIEASMPIKNKRLNQGELYKMITGEPIPRAHRAINDVMANRIIYMYLREQKLINKRILKAEKGA